MIKDAAYKKHMAEASRNLLNATKESVQIDKFKFAIHATTSYQNAFVEAAYRLKDKRLAAAAMQGALKAVELIYKAQTSSHALIRDKKAISLFEDCFGECLRDLDYFLKL